MKLKETFIEPLLHPYASPPVASPTPTDHEYFPRTESPRESIDHLPIASRFLSPTPGLRSETPATVTAQTPSMKDGTPNIDGDSVETDDEANDTLGRGYSANGNLKGSTTRKTGNSIIAAAAAKFAHPQSPYNTRATNVSKGASGKAGLPFPSRSQTSLPQGRMNGPPHGSTASLGRQSIVGVGAPAGTAEREREVSYAATTLTGRTAASAVTTTSKVLKKLRKGSISEDIVLSNAVPPHQLPEDLRICLEVLEDGIYNGHVTLSEGLRKRYEEQYPLVRSLADVFVSNVRDGGSF